LKLSFIIGIIQNEAIPSTADDTIDQWIEMLGIVVDVDASLGTKRAIVADAMAAIGGQSLDYINGRIQSIFPDVYIDEDEAGLGVGPFTTTYYVRGFYPFASDFIRLQAILDRTAPLHLQAFFDARSVYDGDVARCGIGAVGRAICGRTDTAWTPTEGEIGRAGVGVSGMAITGRIPV